MGPRISWWKWVEYPIGAVAAVVKWLTPKPKRCVICGTPHNAKAPKWEDGPYPCVECRRTPCACPEDT